MSFALEEQLATNLYYDRTFDCEAAKILPGEYYYTRKPMLIVTVLGSCVAACIRDRVSGIGGMNISCCRMAEVSPVTPCPRRCVTEPMQWKF